MKTYIRVSLQIELPVETKGQQQETHSMCGRQLDTNTHHAYGVCLPSAEVVELAPSSVAVVSADIKGYMLRLAGKNNTSYSTKSTIYVLNHQEMENNRDTFRQSKRR